MRELSLKGMEGSCSLSRARHVSSQSEREGIVVKRRSENAQTELRRSLVLFKLVLPFCERERGEYARDRTPLGDAQSGLGETRDASDEDDRKDESGGNKEPVRHCGCRKHGKKLCVRLPMRAAI